MTKTVAENGRAPARGAQDKASRSKNLRVRIYPAEKAVLCKMMHEDLISSESAFVRSLILAEARRRGVSIKP
jgi:hypothetical protein